MGSKCRKAAGVLVLGLLSALGPVGAQETDEPGESALSADERAAAELFERAEEEIVRGRYRRAVRLYEKLAEDYPDTELGRIGKERSADSAYIGGVTLLDRGPAANRVDVAILGDGYQLDHQRAFDELAEDVPVILERLEPFEEYASYFNYHRLNLVSRDAGVDGFGRVEETALGAYTRGTIQGHVSVDFQEVSRALANLEPHDGLALIFVRAGVLGSAAGGMAVIGGRDASLIVHEWGHAFGGLGDEYDYRTHDRGGVPLAPNVADTAEPELVPWAHWIAAGARGIGTYQGANGQVRGAWRPTASHCLMGEGEFFCPPCREALVLNIYRFVDPIESTSFPPHPYDHAAELEIAESHRFEVHVMRPASHALEVRWWVLPESEAPAPRRGATAEGRRSSFGLRVLEPLEPIEARPRKKSHVNRTGVHRFKILARDLDPGRYRVVCRARDTTEVRGDRLPWVLKDEEGLLESERAWWIRIPER